VVTRSNPETIAVAADMLANGGTIAQAAAAAQVSRKTVERWRSKGRLELERAPFARLALEADREPPPQPGPFSEADIVELLEHAARQGNVRACELLLRRLRATRLPTLVDDDVFDELDKIAEANRARLHSVQ
jgi:transposase